MKYDGKRVCTQEQVLVTAQLTDRTSAKTETQSCTYSVDTYVIHVHICRICTHVIHVYMYTYVVYVHICCVCTCILCLYTYVCTHRLYMCTYVIYVHICCIGTHMLYVYTQVIYVHICCAFFLHKVNMESNLEIH